MQNMLKLLSALLFTLAAWLMPIQVQAQLTCDNPPAPFDNPNVLASWQRVWDLTDFCQQREDIFFEIISGGVGRDGIPPIDHPDFENQTDADLWLHPSSPVIALEVEGLARAYPLAILTRHEIVNDVIGETPVAVTFCPLCNSAIVFHRQVGDAVLRFGVSGLLRNSDLIMWDDQTQSLWQQFTGEGLVGSYTNALLDILPSQLVGYAAFKAQYPQGEVLSRPMGRYYGSNPYVNYDSSPRPFLFSGAPDSRLFATERVLAVTLDDVSIAYPFEKLAQDIAINDTIADVDVVALWQPGSLSALDASSIDQSRDVGMAALFDRSVQGQILSFRVEDNAIVDDQTGSRWNVFGSAVDGELAGAQLRQINAFPHFWFAWAAFHPDTEVYG